MINYFKNLFFIDKKHHSKYYNAKILPINSYDDDFTHNIITHNNTKNKITNVITFNFQLIKKIGQNFIFAHILILNNENNIFDSEIMIGKNISTKYGAYYAFLFGLEKILSLNIIIDSILIKTPHYDVIKEIQSNNIKKIDPTLLTHYLKIKRFLRNINNIKFEKI